MESTVSSVTNMDTQGRTLETSIQILEALQEGDFGSAGKSVVDKYKEACRQLFPLTKCFMDMSSSTEKAPTNHIEVLEENES